MSQYQASGESFPYIKNHLGGTCVIPAGGTVSLTLPSGAVCAYIVPEGGAAYYAVNGTAAGTVTPGYIPKDTSGMIFEVNNMTSLSVFAAAGVQVHTQFYG